MEFRIEEKGAVSCVGIVKNFGRVTINQDAEHWKEERPDIWKLWDSFLDEGENVIIRDKYKLYRAPYWQVGMDTLLDNGDTVISIGAEARENEQYPELIRFEIPAHKWAVFTCRGTMQQKTRPVTQTMTRVLTEWLPSSGYEIAKGMSLESYGPGDTQSDDYSCELWLPVKKK